MAGAVEQDLHRHDLPAAFIGKHGAGYIGFEGLRGRGHGEGQQRGAGEQAGGEGGTE